MPGNNPVPPVASGSAPATPAPAATPAKKFDRAAFDAAMSSYHAHSQTLAAIQGQHDQANAKASDLLRQHTAAAAEAAQLASQVANAHAATIDDLKTALTALNYDPAPAVGLLTSGT